MNAVSRHNFECIVIQLKGTPPFVLDSFVGSAVIECFYNLFNNHIIAFNPFHPSFHLLYQLVLFRVAGG